MAHYEPPHQDLRCLQIQLFSSLVAKELIQVACLIKMTTKTGFTVIYTLASRGINFLPIGSTFFFGFVLFGFFFFFFFLVL